MKEQVDSRLQKSYQQIRRTSRSELGDVQEGIAFACDPQIDSFRARVIDIGSLKILQHRTTRVCGDIISKRASLPDTGGLTVRSRPPTCPTSLRRFVVHVVAAMAWPGVCGPIPVMKRSRSGCDGGAAVIV